MAAKTRSSGAAPRIELIESVLTGARAEKRKIFVGTPANEKEISGLEKAVGFSFPASYRRFVASYGALAIGGKDGEPGFAVFGHAKEKNAAFLNLGLVAKTFRASGWNGYEPTDAYRKNVVPIGGAFESIKALSDAQDFYLMSKKGIGWVRGLTIEGPGRPDDGVVDWGTLEAWLEEFSDVEAEGEVAVKVDAAQKRRWYLTKNAGKPQWWKVSVAGKYVDYTWMPLTGRTNRGNRSFSNFRKALEFSEALVAEREAAGFVAAPWPDEVKP